MKKWFITGCSAGLGKALAEYLLPKGYTVIATVRQDGALADLVAKYPDTLDVVVLDVNYPEAIETVVKAAVAKHKVIDVVVNNAGYGLVGNLEGMSMEQIRHQFETNFFGSLGVIKAFMPLMRAYGGGHFLNVTSIAGINVSPGGSIYSATKFALEALSEGLAKEGVAVNIRSTAIEPGPFRTDWAGRSLVFAEKDIEAYLPTVGQFKAYLENANGKQKGDPEKAAEAMEAVTLLDKPPLRLALGAAAYRVLDKKLNDLATEAAVVKHIGFPTDYPESV